jgi:hypothetical protein
MKAAITGKELLMGFSASPGMQASVVRWAESQPDKPSLAEALRRLVELGLTVKAPRKQSQGGRSLKERKIWPPGSSTFYPLIRPTSRKRQAASADCSKDRKSFETSASTERRNEMGERSKGVGLHHRRFDLCPLDGFAAAILLRRPCGLVTIGLKARK